MSAELAELIPTPDQLRLDAERPWPGLVAFREADAAFFHGRDSDIANLYRMVMRERLTVLFGMSGLGKTSLLQAGLFPKLRDENLLPIRIRLDYADQSPPLLQQIKQAIVVFAGAAKVESPPVQNGETLWEYFHKKGAVFWNTRNRVMTPVLVFDQFEEVFTLGRDNPARAAEIKEIIGELADLIEGHCPETVKSRLDQYPEEAQQYAFNHHPYKLVFSLREDFLADFEGLRRQIPSVIHNRLRLRSMHGEQALQVVTKAGGHLVDTDVALAIVNFVAAAQASGSPLLEELDIEPALLSLICHELNEKRIQIGATQIGAALLAGSSAEILEGFYERCLANQAPELRHFIEDRLITTSGYRDSVAYESALETSGVTAEMLGRLVEQRLLRAEDWSGQRRIELIHDVLTGVVRKSRDQRRLGEQWDEHHEAVLKDWRQRTAAASEAHYKLASSFRRQNLVWGFTVVIFSSVVGASLFPIMAVPEAIHPVWKLAIISISVATAILVALQTFLRFGERAEKHVIAADWYASVCRDIYQLLAFSTEERGSPKDCLDRIRKEISKIGQQSPEIDDRLWKVMVAKYGVEHHEALLKDWRQHHEALLKDWRQHHEALLKDWRQRTAAASEAHYKLASGLRKKNLMLGVPLVTSSNVVGTGVVAVPEDIIPPAFKIALLLNGIGTAILVTLQTFLRFGERAEKHLIAADWYASVCRDIDTLSTEERARPKECLDRIRKEISKIRQQSPEIGDRLWKVMATKYGVDIAYPLAH